MSALVLDILTLDLAEVDSMIADLWADQPIPADYNNYSEYERDLEFWRSKMQEMSDALETASELEREINSIGQI